MHLQLNYSCIIMNISLYVLFIKFIEIMHIYNRQSSVLQMTMVPQI